MKSFLFFVAAVVAIGLLGTLAMNLPIDNWYGDLKKPNWTPPNWMFSVVWTGLYFLIAIAGWIVYEKTKGTSDTFPMKIYWVQLFLNALWPWLFFGLQNTGLAFLDLILLFFAVLINISAFWRISPLAAMLLMPYLIWAAFALSLNFVIYLYNELNIMI